MDFERLFRVYYWWQAVFVCGVLLSASALMFDIQFIERKQILGLGFGMVFIGIGYWKAKMRVRKPYMICDKFIFDFWSKIFIFVGSLIFINFLIRILISLSV